MPSEMWRSQVGFLLAGIGYTLSMGNVWRFPYITGQTYGNAFLIPSILSLCDVNLTPSRY